MRKNENKNTGEMKEMKRTIYSNIIYLVVAVIAIVSTTFAWFNNASVSSDESILKSVNVDFSIYMYDNSSKQPLNFISLDSLSFGALIDENEEPFSKGSKGYKYFAVKNTGSQPLLMDIKIKIDEKSVEMAEVMKFSVTSLTTEEEAAGILLALDWIDIGTEQRNGDIAALNRNPILILVGESRLIRIDYWMYDDLANPEDTCLKTDIIFTAVQSNSFDSNVQDERVIYVSDLEDLKNKLASAKDGATIIFTRDIIASGEDIELSVSNSYNVNLNRYILSARSIEFVEPALGSSKMLSIENGIIECDILRFNMETAVHLSADLELYVRDFVDSERDNVFSQRDETE